MSLPDWVNRTGIIFLTIQLATQIPRELILIICPVILQDFVKDLLTEQPFGNSIICQQFIVKPMWGAKKLKSIQCIVSRDQWLFKTKGRIKYAKQFIKVQRLWNNMDIWNHPILSF